MKLVNLGNLILLSGNDKVVIGNGALVPISHTSQTILSTKTQNLLLNNILHTHKLTTNLIYIQKLCQDNDVYVKFHSHLFFIKDKVTKKVLLKRPLDKGLYKVFCEIDTASKYTKDSTSIIAPLATTFIWHERLYHIHDSIVHRVLSSLNTNVIKLSTQHVNESCKVAKSHKQ